MLHRDPRLVRGTPGQLGEAARPDPDRQRTETLLSEDDAGVEASHCCVLGRESDWEETARYGIRVNAHLIWRISKRNSRFQPARLRRVLTLPLVLLGRTRLRAKRRTTAMFLAPLPVRYRDSLAWSHTPSGQGMRE